jgi:signal transduction histidine kinase
MRGAAAHSVVLLRDQSGDERRLHVSAAAIGGERRGVVLSARDITNLHAAIATGAQLDGAVKTARLVAHELNNQLAPVAGYSELLGEEATGEVKLLAGRINRAALRAAGTLNQLQQIIRFEETEFAGQVMLDLDAATTDHAE